MGMAGRSLGLFGRVASIMLVSPQIPQNTGNVGRTAMGMGCPLHLVGNLGFSLDEKALRRAGLDYWKHLEVSHHASYDAALDAIAADTRMFFITKTGPASLLDTSFFADAPQPTAARPDDDRICLVFGSEITGLGDLLERFPHSTDAGGVQHVRVPQIDTHIRCYNLASTVSLVTWEAYRQFHCALE
ncbi:RNA methyltransferase TrmH [Thecamonas trahens ATCC 50062]|uniref:RNA methyltransferase TrmH n=1 Tax=Thecamonas trahens ATCC 50062 TaxID=461836 RepID=A0A0L0DJG6_THETB|nr:RNA methyltransferase TrmH [Thecamonas trahens ATCC 50062]KNC52554.1 RNA methyltransferase TrmH [Thecamonas trahens ATCC 50062]|eukprot:XP_013755344.1 RNA methyltransferase TrmH [Thecamonas trahens ATCC 50062]